MKLKAQIKFYLVFAAVLIAVGGNAQNEITVREAIELALERKLQIRIADKNNEIAEKNNTWSEAGAFPTLSVSLTSANGLQDNTKNPFTFTPGMILSQSLQPALSLDWNIFSGMGVIMSKRRLEQLEEQSKGNATVIIETTVSDIIKGYYSAVMHKERLELLRELTAFSREQVKYYELKEEYAGASSLELMQFKNQYLSDSTNLLMQEISYRNALRNLNLLMNLPLDSLLNPTDQLDFILPEINGIEAKRQLVENNNNLKNQMINIRLSEIQTKYQRSFLFPTLTFQGGIQPGFSWIREVKNDLFEAETQTLMYSANLTLRYNVFNNWKSKRAVEVSKIQEEISQLNYDEMKNSLMNSMEGLLEMFEARNRLVAVSSQNIEYAGRVWEIGQERLRLGTINSIELQTLRNSYINARLTHLDNLYNRVEVFFEIFRLTGNIGLYHSQVVE